MKSAFELALERSGGSLNEVPEDKKTKLNEIDLIFQSKIAEARISAENKRKKLETPEQIQELEEGLLNEIASLNSRCEREKEAVRKS